MLTNDETGEKRGFSSPVNRPAFALMNPELTYSLSKRQTACGVVDIMMHTLDRYFSTDVVCETTDAVAEALLRTVIHYGPAVMKEPSNYEARSEIMWCGTLSHSDLTGLGRPKSFVVHQMGHILSGRFDLPHAESLSCVFCQWAREVCGYGIGRFARYAREVWKISEPDDETAALAGIGATERFFRALDMPVCFGEAEMGVLSDEDVRDMARECSWDGKRLVGTFHPLDEAGILRVLRAANH
ncbi:Alcohol dehydrogenase YqhD [bioreactor metagenome]|uniref:Alcohol dehydrogenase YqhD n=1 Tax=bioreactor metagenome TaxID=1076179 RepID=A0A645ACJ9_9ZZZZ